MPNLDLAIIGCVVAVLALVLIVVLYEKAKSSNKNLKKKFQSKGYKHPFSCVQRLKGVGVGWLFHFHNPFHAQPKKLLSKPEIEKKVVPTSSSSNNDVLRPVIKEDYSPHYIEMQLAKFTQHTNSNHVVLQMGFCCQKPNTKLVATNHTTQLFDCSKDNCKQKLIKVTIGNWS